MAIRKLNLVMSYPINWSIYSVMNNFVQNFYDALKHENFMEHFEYKFEENTIILKSDVGFSKEWLFFMGASSKREKERKYAGKFGEGFKVASLVAYRDFGLGIQMESREWRLAVTEAEDEIDGVKKYVKVKGQKNKKYEINRLVFGHEDFRDEVYLESLIKMAEALLHVYGTDRSSTLTVLLTHLGQWILDGEEIVSTYEMKWNGICEES